MTMGEIIKFHRTKLDLSQDDLGSMVGVNRAAVQKWESGKVQNIKRNTIKKLSEIFNIFPSELMGWDENCKSKNSFFDEMELKEKYGILPIKTKKSPY